MKQKAVKPLLRGHFHQAMFFVTLGATIPLLIRTSNLLEAVAIFVYSCCALLMFGVSSLYHRVNWNPPQRAWWKKFDHAGIFLMIAGCFTPIALLGLKGASGEKVLITIWVIACIGVIQSFFFVKTPKIISAVIYLFAGYQILPYMAELSQAIGEFQIFLLIAGGLSYTVGALCYGLKKPILWPHYFGYHEVFHLFVNLGAIIHYFVIHSLIK